MFGKDNEEYRAEINLLMLKNEGLEEELMRKDHVAAIKYRELKDSLISGYHLERDKLKKELWEANTRIKLLEYDAVNKVETDAYNEAHAEKEYKIREEQLNISHKEAMMVAENSYRAKVSELNTKKHQELEAQAEKYRGKLDHNISEYTSFVSKLTEKVIEKLPTFDIKDFNVTTNVEGK